MQDPTTMRINIVRYLCLLHGPLDAYMRRTLNEMLSEEQARLAAELAEPRRQDLPATIKPA